MKGLSASLVALAAALSASGAAAACPDAAVRIATTGIPPQYPMALSHQDELLQRVPRRADMMLVGDSLFAAWPPESLARLFPGKAVWNYAVGGDRTQTMLWRISQVATKDVDVRAVTILAGTNNLSDGDMPACAVAAGVETLADRIHAIWPAASLFVMTVPPRGEGFAFRDRDRREINRLLGEWAGASRYARLVALPEDELTCAGAAGPCRNYEPDLLHFRPGAYEIFGRALRAAIDR